MRLTTIAHSLLMGRLGFRGQPLLAMFLSLQAAAVAVQGQAVVQEQVGSSVILRNLLALLHTLAPLVAVVLQRYQVATPNSAH